MTATILIADDDAVQRHQWASQPRGDEFAANLDYPNHKQGRETWRAASPPTK